MMQQFSNVSGSGQLGGLRVCYRGGVPRRGFPSKAMAVFTSVFRKPLNFRAERDGAGVKKKGSESSVRRRTALETRPLLPNR